MKSPRNNVNRKWELYLKGDEYVHPLTFSSEVAEKNRNAFFITPFHPLLKQAAEYFKTESQLCVHLDFFSDDLPKGDYLFAIYAWDYIGLRSNFRLVPVCENEVLESMLPEYIMTAAEAEKTELRVDADWNVLEVKQVAALMKERETHLETTRQFANYKLESLQNSFNNRKNVLERKISESQSQSLINMYSSELATARERFELKHTEIMKQVENADIHSTQQ